MSILPSEFIKELSTNVDRATLVTLSGPLGAGKTTFAQGIAEVLGVKERVTSPTFVIENIYALPAGRQGLTGKPWKRLIHIDAYRLESGAELEHLGWNKIVADKENLIVLEWPERVAEIIPKDALRLQFEMSGDERIITRHG
jgi:tRNA threonylcarbamoyl adenosine modification protein YjeE